MKLFSCFGIIAGILCSASALAVPQVRTPTHVAKVVVEIVYDKNPQEALRKRLPKNDSSVTFAKQRNTGLFEIRVTAQTREAAAQRANDIAFSVKRAFDNEGTYGGFVIREFAEPRPPLGKPD